MKQVPHTHPARYICETDGYDWTVISISMATLIFTYGIPLEVCQLYLDDCESEAHVDSLDELERRVQDNPLCPFAVSTDELGNLCQGIWYNIHRGLDPLHTD